jgi:membrane fusion protein (multidrug efflux system)
VFVLTTDAEGKTRAQARKVESGTVLGDEVIITSGLVVGDRVAAFGSFKLRDGVLVAIIGDAPPAGK